MRPYQSVSMDLIRLVRNSLQGGLLRKRAAHQAEIAARCWIAPIPSSLTRGEPTDPP